MGMAVVKQKPLINDTVLTLAEEAAVGDVFIYSNNEYQWTPRSEAWLGVMLTKTERGFELIDKNGRSHGIVNLGEPYHNVDPNPACTACDKAYVYQNAVAEITAVCCDQELYVGNCSGEGWSVDWCPLCICFGITDITGIETELEKNTEGTLFVYDISVREACDCEGKVLVEVTSTESSI